MDPSDLIEVLLGLFFFIVLPILRAIADKRKKKQAQAQAHGEALGEAWWAEEEPPVGEPPVGEPKAPVVAGAPVAFGAPVGASADVMSAALEEADQLILRAGALAKSARVERITNRFADPLDDFVVAQARDLRSAVGRGGLTHQQLRAGLDALWLVVRQIEDFVQQRRDPRLGPLVSDADALAKACYTPIVDFARAHSIALTSTEPVTDYGESRLGTWTGFIPTGLAPLALPTGFFERLAWWPALAHEIGHDFLAAAPGLDGRLREQLGLPSEGSGRWPLRFSDGGIADAELYRIFGGWFEEIFCDVFGTLMVGPAYAWSLVELFPSPANPSDIIRVGAGSGGIAGGLLYDPHPPRHLRLLISTYILEQIGRHHDAEQVREQWARLHGGWPSAILFPVGRSWVPVPLEPLAEIAHYLADKLYNEPFEGLAGYRLADIPGVDFGPRASAETARVASEILEGNVPHKTNARWVIAGAIEAWHQAPEREAEIIALVRRGISGVGTFEQAEDAYSLVARPIRSPAAIEDAREAFLLHTILGPPVALQRR